MHSAFSRAFTFPPFVHAPPYVHAPTSIAHTPSFRYEQDGRGTNFANFTSAVRKAFKKGELHAYQTHPVLVARMCAVDLNFITDGVCLPRVIQRFVACAKETGFPRALYNAPFVHTLLSRPSPALVRILGVMRRRLSLPAPPADEPAPGAYGLRSSGYFMIALHFRNAPRGFEAVSAQHQDADSRTQRTQALASFWVGGTRAIQQALAVARCRNETLLIVFSTDDALNLRPQAVQV